VIRDLNDEINKRIREKRHWERRIVELGGPDYARAQPAQAYDADGVEVRGAGGGYKYFGAAKNLPGVRELFQRDEPEARRRSRQDKHIEPDYYGFRDDEDAEQLAAEQQAEQRLIGQALEDWEEVDAEKRRAVDAANASSGSQDAPTGVRWLIGG
jgi:pre-mRNA-splicing factor ISY1